MRDPLLPSTDLSELPVYDAGEVPIGVTFGVLTEAETGLVRYFDVSLDGRQRHVLVPVGHGRVETHLGRLRLRLRAATARELESIPAYEPHVTWQGDAFQNELLDAFGKLFDGQRYYAHPAYDHTGLYAGTHPLLRDPLAPSAACGLHRLSALRHFRVSDGEPDIRGWPLIGENKLRLATVDDLVVDTDAEQVRYVVIRRDIDDQPTALPIGYLELGDQTVHAPLNQDDLQSLPRFTTEELTRDQETVLRVALDNLLRGQRTYLRPDFRTAA
ncbi:MAG TPA: PRC-barrel domain-containing protein [Longimicrobiales bacterium]